MTQYGNQFVTQLPRPEPTEEDINEFKRSVRYNYDRTVRNKVGSGLPPTMPEEAFMLGPVTQAHESLTCPSCGGTSDDDCVECGGAGTIPGDPIEGEWDHTFGWTVDVHPNAGYDMTPKPAEEPAAE